MLLLASLAFSYILASFATLGSVCQPVGQRSKSRSEVEIQDYLNDVTDFLPPNINVGGRGLPLRNKRPSIINGCVFVK